MDDPTPASSGELDCSIAALALYPVKSCAGIAVDSALLVETGLDLDRTWMVVDESGSMLTQRDWPRLALVRPTLKFGEIVLRAPGMLTLHLRVDTVESSTRVRVWDDIVKAFDMGDLAAQWFTSFLAQAPAGDGSPPPRVRLARFDPDQQRLSDPAWAGGIAAENAFSDGYPLLVAGRSSLAELNDRLAARDAAPVGIDRFRPNIVLAGLQAFDEDLVDELTIATADGPVRLRLVKPCVRCRIPNVDPATGATGSEPGATLAGFRADPRMKGGVTFGVNAVIVDGVDRTLRCGQRVGATFRF